MSLKALYITFMAATKPLFFLKSLFFIPALNINGQLFPLHGVGWTLNMEMFFYIIFAFALFFGKKLAPILAILVLLAVKAIYLSGLCTNIYFKFYSHDYIMFFIAGIILHYLYNYFQNKVISKKISLLFIISSIAFLLLFNLTHIFTNDFISYLPPTFLVGAALAGHLSGIQCNNKNLILLGNASYSIYLIHCIIIEHLRCKIIDWPVLDFSHNLIGLSVVFIITIFLSVITYKYLEAPTIKKLKSIFTPKKDYAKPNENSKIPEIEYSSLK